jgi:hypothetical protein
MEIQVHCKYLRDRPPSLPSSQEETRSNTGESSGSEKGVTTLLDSIILVIVGAAIGYLPSALIERRRRMYELKKQIYFEFIDVMAEGRRLFINEEISNGIAWVDTPDPFPSEKMDSWFASFEAVRYKMEISASNEIKKLIKTEWPDSSLKRFDMVEEFYEKLMPLIRSDLIMNGWL